MNAEEIKAALESRGWTVSLVNSSEVDDLVEAEENGLLKCVDGRLSDHDAMRGPKALGGVYAIASLRGITNVDGLAAIVDEVRAAGYGPSVHGDEHAAPASMGCGYFKLWATGKLDGLEPPQFDSEQGREAVLAAGGVYEQLAGDHAEKLVVINLVPNTTLEPKEDQRFVVDAWVAEDFDLDAGRYLTLAAQTVELLNGPKIATIITP